MAGTEIATRQDEPQPILPQLSNAQLKYIANTDFVPKSMRGNLPAILACVATGRALGLADMEALRSIHIVDGKATFSAELMVNLTRRAGHSISAEFGDGLVTVRGRRGDNGDEITVTWTISMAERAGLADKQNWRKYPEAMLWARAVSQLCRMLFADVFAGQTYTADEAEMSDEEKIDEVLDAKGPLPDDGGPEDVVDAPAEIVQAEALPEDESNEQETIEALNKLQDESFAGMEDSFEAKAARAQAKRGAKK